MITIEEYAAFGVPLQPWETTTKWATLLSLSDRAVRAMCERGEIRAKKFGRVWRIDSRWMLDKLMQD